MIRYVEGDLLALAEAGMFDVIVHGCNCFNTMGAGIARAIADRYPEAAEVDFKTIRGDVGKLGTYTSAKAHSGFTIVNAYTQYGVATYNEDVFEYEAFTQILKKLAEQYPDARFGFPLIGCGLAGGNRELILAQIDQYLTKEINGTVTIVIFRP